MRQENPKKVFRVFICVIYKILVNYVCIDYLASKSKGISELPVGNGGGFKHEEKSYDKILGIGNPDLLMNFISCYRFLKKKYPVVIFKCPKIMLEYYFSKIFTYFYWNIINLEKFQMR